MVVEHLVIILQILQVERLYQLKMELLILEGEVELQELDLMEILILVKVQAVQVLLF